MPILHQHPIHQHLYVEAPRKMDSLLQTTDQGKSQTGRNLYAKVQSQAVELFGGVHLRFRPLDVWLFFEGL